MQMQGLRITFILLTNHPVHQSYFHSCLLCFQSLFLLRLNESTTCSTCKIPLSNTLCGHQRLSEHHTHVPALCSSITLTWSSWCLHSFSPSQPEPRHSARPWFAPFSSYCFFISSVGSICLTSSLLFNPGCTPRVSSLLCLLSTCISFLFRH